MALTQLFLAGVLVFFFGFTYLVITDIIEDWRLYKSDPRAHYWKWRP